MTQPSPAQREQLQAADQVMNLFAQESLLALKAYEDSFPADAPDRAQKVGERLAYHWNRYGLDEVTPGKDCGDAQRVLWAAAKIASDPASRGLRTSAAEGVAKPGTIARLSADLNRRFGDSLPVPPPGQWLDESLSRLAKASVLQDVVRLEAKVAVDVSRDAQQASPNESAQQAAADFVRQGQRLGDQSREVAAAASKLRTQEPDYYRNQSLLATAWASATIATGAIEPWWAELAVRIPVTGYLVQRAAEAYLERRDLQRLVGAGQSELRSVRTELIGSLDHTPGAKPDTSTARTGRAPEDGPRDR